MTPIEAYEVEVEDGNSILKEIFRPDYAKTRELESGKVRLTGWHQHVIRKIEHRLKQDGSPQHGLNYVRRRLIIHGLGKVIEDVGGTLEKLEKKYDAWIENYDRRENQRNKKASIIGDIDGRDRVTIYMEENDFGRVRELSEIFNISIDSMERIAIAYTILELDAIIDSVIIEEAQKDIEEFKEHIRSVAL